MRLIRRILYLIFFVAVVIAVGMFIAQNNKPMTIELFHWRTDTLPTYLLVFFCLLIGAVITGVIGLLELVKVEGRARRLERTLKKIRKDHGLLKTSLKEAEEKQQLEQKAKEEELAKKDDYSVHQSHIQSFKKIP